MKELQGSEKQISWAKEIREQILNGVMCISNGTKVCVDEGIKQHVDRLEKSRKSDLEDLANETNEEVLEDIKRDIKTAEEKIVLFKELTTRIENESNSVWFIENRAIHNLLTKEVFSK